MPLVTFVTSFGTPDLIDDLSLVSGATETAKSCGKLGAMVQPAWADTLLSKVSSDYGCKPPRVYWIQRNRAGTSGRYHRWRKTITICLGTDPEHYQQVLLHELAHWLTRKGGHTKKFWLKLDELLKRYNLCTESYVAREVLYKRRAVNYLSTT